MTIYESDYYIDDLADKKIKLVRGTQFISPRVAEYYPKLAVYDVGIKHYIICPNVTPHL